jgi:hypothetical protein
MKRQEQILNKLTPEEISALAYGFPMPNESYYNNFNDKLESTGTTTDVNGAWKPLGVNNFDGFDFVDDSYDNFLTKKSRERNERKKELRDEGKSRKDARKQAKEEIPKDKLKDIAKNVGKGIGRGIVVGALSIPRASYLSLLALNFRGNAYKIKAIANLENGTPASVKEELQKKWYKLGGDWDALVKSAMNGAKRKPFFCGKKCKKELIDKNYKKSSFNGEVLDFDTFSYPTGVEEVGVGVWIGLASSVIGALSGIIIKGQEGKQQKREIESVEKLAEQENKTLSEADKRAYDLEMAKLNKEVDPKVLITNNPNLTPQEKTMALTQLDEATTKETSQNFKKYALYGGIAIIGIFAISKFMKKK